MSFFINCGTIEEAKNLYRNLAKKYHPDIFNGDNKKMLEINLEFEKFCKNFLKNTDSKNSNFDFKDYELILKKIIYLENVKIEIIGSWIYVFNAFYAKDILKNLGFWFSTKHKAWIFNNEEKNKFRKTKLKTEEIKNKFGVVEIKTNSIKKIS